MWLLAAGLDARLGVGNLGDDEFGLAVKVAEHILIFGRVRLVKQLFDFVGIRR